MAMEERQLNYGSPKSGKVLRRLRRWAVPLAATAIGVALAVWFGPRFVRNLELLRRQRAAVAFVPPTWHVTATAHYVENVYDNGGSDSMHPVTYNPPDPWSYFTSVAGLPAAPAVFLGELSSKAGQRRVVVVGGWIVHRPAPGAGGAPTTTAAAPGLGFEQFMLSAHVLRSGTITSPPAYARRDRVAFAARVPAGPPAQLFAGRRDPADPSRFTIEYRSESSRGVIKGRLRDDDSIVFSLLSGPATETAP
jgi:hypothetical protein